MLQERSIAAVFQNKERPKNGLGVPFGVPLNISKRLATHTKKTDA